MCNCNDNINSTTVFSGPQGPTGPQGPAVIINGTSTTNLTVGTGSTTLTTQSGIDWLVGQRVRIYNSGSTKIMEGLITSYSSTTLVVNVDWILGTGSASSWTIVITGNVGSTGATGSTGAAGSAGSPGNPAYSILSASIILSSNTYQIDVGNTDWMGVGQVLFIENSGYYKVVSIPTNSQVIILDLGYINNTPTFIPNSKVSPGGFAGHTFLYETTDGNGNPATATNAYDVLIRNSSNTGYIFISISAFKALLAAQTPVTNGSGNTW